MNELKRRASDYTHYQKVLLPQNTVAGRENGRLRRSVFYVTCEDDIERVLHTEFYPVKIADGRGVVGVIVGIGHTLQDAVILARPPGGETSHYNFFCPWRGIVKGFQKEIHVGKRTVSKEKAQGFQNETNVEARIVSKRKRGQSPGLQSGQPLPQDGSRVKSSLIHSDNPGTNVFSSSRSTSVLFASSRNSTIATSQIDFPPRGRTFKQPVFSTGPPRADFSSWNFSGLDAELKPAASLLLRNKKKVVRHILLKARGLTGQEDDPAGKFQYFLGDQADEDRPLESRWHALYRSRDEGREIGIVVVQGEGLDPSIVGRYPNAKNGHFRIWQYQPHWENQLSPDLMAGFSHERENIKCREGTAGPVLRSWSLRRPRFRPRSAIGEVRVRRPRPNSVASTGSVRSVIDHGECTSFMLLID